MNKIMMGLIICLIPSLVYAEKSYVKCHIRTDNAVDTVEQFVYPSSSISSARLAEFTASLAGKSIFATDGKQRVAILQVFECAELQGKFKSNTARELELQIPH